MVYPEYDLGPCDPVNPKAFVFCYRGGLGALDI